MQAMPIFPSAGALITNPTRFQVFESLLKKEASSVKQRATPGRTQLHKNESEQRTAQLVSMFRRLLYKTSDKG